MEVPTQGTRPLGSFGGKTADTPRIVEDRRRKLTGRHRLRDPNRPGLLTHLRRVWVRTCSRLGDLLALAQKLVTLDRCRYSDVASPFGVGAQNASQTPDPDGSSLSQLVRQGH